MKEVKNRVRSRFHYLSVLVLILLASGYSWAEQSTDTAKLTALHADSLDLLDTAYREPSPEFECGSDAVMRYPKEFQRRPQASVVDLEFTRTADGFARDYYVTREKHPAFAREAIEYLRQCRFAPLPESSFGQSLRLLFKFSSDERSTTLYLRKLKRSARKGTPGRKRFYAYNVELATSFDNIPRAAEANRWYLKAANEGDAKAQFQVGLRLFYGRGFRTQPELGMQWLQRAAAGGSGGANFALAQLIKPEGAPISSVQRKAYLRAATEVGHTGAALALARMLVASAGIDHDQLVEVPSLLESSKEAWDKERWLLTAARYALAVGALETAELRISEARQYVAAIGHPLTAVEQLTQVLRNARETEG